MDADEEPSKPTPAATLLLSIRPVNHGNNKGKPINLVAILSTMLVKPTYLQWTSNATFADADMIKFFELTQGLSPNFWIVYRLGVPLVVQHYNSSEQIVFQVLVVFRHWKLKNITGIVFQGTLEPENHLNYCVNIYGGQKCTPMLHNFANNIVSVHLQKIALNIFTEHCNYCQYYLHDSIHTPLTLLLTYLLHRASNESSQLLIVSPSLHVS